MARTLFAASVVCLLAGLVVVSPAQAQASPAKTLRIPFPELSGWGLDPHLERTGEAFRFLSLVYESLYTWAPGDTHQVVPCLAEDFPAVSGDKLTYTFRIRSGVKYHPNLCFGEARTREVTAQDFVDGFKRLRASSSGTTGMGWMMGRLIVGLDEYADSVRGQAAPLVDDTVVEGLKAPDSRTLVIKLTRPCAAIVQMLAHGAFCPMPREFIRDKRVAMRECGTGPYRLAAISAGSIYVVEANSAYWGEAPGYERITFAAVSRYNELTGGVRSGRFAEMPMYSNWYSSLVKGGKLAGPLASAPATLKHTDDSGYYYAAFNMSDPIWGALDADGNALRRAVCLAMQRSTLAEAADFPPEWARDFEQLFPPGLEFEETDDELGFGRHDLAEAKKVLDGSKYKGGKNPATGEALVLEALLETEAFHSAVADELQAALRELGIKLEVQYTGKDDDYRAAYQDCTEHLYVAGWFLDFPGAQNFLQLFWSGNVGIADEFQNNARYRSDEFDKLYAELEALLPTAANAGKRRELVGKLGATLARHQPIIPLFMRRNMVVQSTDIEWGKVGETTHLDLRYAKAKLK